MYSSQSILEAGGAGVLIFLAMVLHGLAALVILYLLLTTAGRKTSHSLFASIAAMFHSVVQTAWFCLLGVSFISIPIEKVLNMSMDIDLSGMEFLMLIGLGSGPIAILLLLRLMRSSMIIRCGALAIPAPLPLLMLAYAVNRTLTDSSWLSLLAFPLALILPGFACLAYATGVVDQSASPLVVALPDIQGAGMLEYSFSYLWFVKLACQSILLPVLFIMARDAIRLYRQPGQL